VPSLETERTERTHTAHSAHPRRLVDTLIRPAKATGCPSPLEPRAPWDGTVRNNKIVAPTSALRIACRSCPICPTHSPIERSNKHKKNMEEAEAAASSKATMLGTKRARSEEESDESDDDDDDDDGNATDDGTPEDKAGGVANTTNSKTKKNKNSKGAAALSKVRRSRDGFTTDPSKLAMMSRSERKRHREKKRRSDVNKGFEDLTNLLVEVDAGVRMEVEEERARRLQAKAGDAAGTTGSNSNTNTNTNHKSKKALLSLSALASGSSVSLQGDDNVLSRVDLIDRATTVLRRLHTENEQRKVLIEHLMAAQGQRGLNVNVAPDLSSSASSPFFLFGHEPSSWVRVRSRLTRMGSGCGTYHDGVCCSQRTAYTLAVFVLPCRFSGTLLRRVTEACQRTRPC
jgi:Helix-loop-helix DNA-binding domain